MANFGEALAVLDSFRADLHEGQADEIDDVSGPKPVAAFSASGSTVPGLAGPLTNVHATGVGLRTRAGKVVPTDYVIKVYVFDKRDLGNTAPSLTSQPYQGVGVDVEALPVQQALAQPVPPLLIPNRNRQRPVVGGVSIAPLNAPFVGTLGCFVRRRRAGMEQLFVLSNNHVLADVNRLPLGTSIVQPGAETGPTLPADVFAQLSSFIPIQFPQAGQPAPTNFFDAAIAQVTDPALIRRAAMLGIANYTPGLKAPVPGMAVTKSGRTTGVTQGMVIATHVNGVQINYGTQANPVIAVFNDAVQIRSAQGSFSRPGDSGSVILDTQTGRGTALLFAGDGVNTFACSLAGACRRFRVTLA